MQYLPLKKIIQWMLVSAASACFISCQTQPKLEPGLKSAAEKEAVQAKAEGVKILVKGSEWSGRDAVMAHVTPLKVDVHNEGDEPVLIRYQEFSLVTEGGARFAALPLFEIEGSVEEPIAISYARPPYEARFYHHNFYTAPYYSSVFPGLEPYPYTYRHPGGGYAKSYDYWKEIELPTKAMQESALPEGALEPGGRVQGHLFFEKVPADVGSVHLNFELLNAETGQAIESGELPLRVVE